MEKMIERLCLHGEGSPNYNNNNNIEKCNLFALCCRIIRYSCLLLCSRITFMDDSHKLAQCKVQGADFSHRGSVIEANNWASFGFDMLCAFFSSLILFCWTRSILFSTSHHSILVMILSVVHSYQLELQHESISVFVSMLEEKVWVTNRLGL